MVSFCSTETFFTERIAIPEIMDKTKIRQMDFNNSFIAFGSCYNFTALLLTPRIRIASIE